MISFLVWPPWRTVHCTTETDKLTEITEVLQQRLKVIKAAVSQQDDTHRGPRKFLTE